MVYKLAMGILLWEHTILATLLWEHTILATLLWEHTILATLFWEHSIIATLFMKLTTVLRNPTNKRYLLFPTILITIFKKQTLPPILL